MQEKMTRIFRNQTAWLLIISLLGLMGIGLVIYSTKWGAALSDDSYYYISSARNLLAGNGFNLISHFPPLLPLLLSAIGLFKVDPLVGIRWLNAILFAVNIFLVARIVLELTRSYIFSILAGVLAMVSSTLIMIHSWAMSEALFLCLTLAGILIYTISYEKLSWKIPLFTGLAFGLATATRYIGAALLIAGGIVWLIETGKSFQIRLRNTLIFSISGVLPVLLWMIRNEITTGQPTSRAFESHLMPASMWINMLNTILLWIIPGRFVHGKEIYWLAGMIFLLVSWLGINLIRNRVRSNPDRRPDPIEKPVVLVLLLIPAYLIVLIISRSYLDSHIPMDERLLSPLLAMGLVLLVWFLARQWNAKQWLKFTAMALVVVILMVTNLTRSAQMVQSYHELGRGYASARDHISETYAYLRKRPDIPIYSNAFAAIYFWTNRVTLPLPPASGIQAMKANMKQTGAYLVIFYSIPVELYGVNMQELTQGLIEQIRLSEATIYRAP